MADFPDLEIVYRNPADLDPFEDNARTHSQEQVDAIAASITRFGFRTPIALKDDERTIGAGHGRQLAALSLGLPRVPTNTLRGMTEAEWRAFVIADNRLAEQAGWDFDKLKSELASIRLGDGILATVAGFSNAELDALLGSLKTPSLDDLENQFGKPAASDFWPWIKVQVPPALQKRWDKVMAKARSAGADDHAKVAAILDAVDMDKLGEKVPAK